MAAGGDGTRYTVDLKRRRSYGELVDANEREREGKMGPAGSSPPCEARGCGIVDGDDVVAKIDYGAPKHGDVKYGGWRC